MDRGRSHATRRGTLQGDRHQKLAFFWRRGEKSCRPGWGGPGGALAVVALAEATRDVREEGWWWPGPGLSLLAFAFFVLQAAAAASASAEKRVAGKEMEEEWSHSHRFLSLWLLCCSTCVGVW
jgi:hypothetical protein